jgi:leader peptidase (prepilin peptidase) / N-methyltransferase
MAVPSPQVPVAEVAASQLLRTRNILIGLGAAFLAACSFARFGLTAEAFVGAFFAGTLLVLSVIDVERRKIPDRIVLPATAVVLAAQLAFFPDHALEWVVAGIGAALFFFLPLLVYPQGMGLGDVKLALFLGVGLGMAVVGALTVALLAVFVVAVAMIARGGREARNKMIPFGPFLALGGVVALFFS